MWVCVPLPLLPSSLSVFLLVEHGSRPLSGLARCHALGKLAGGGVLRQRGANFAHSAARKRHAATASGPSQGRQCLRVLRRGFPFVYSYPMPSRDLDAAKKGYDANDVEMSIAAHDAKSKLTETATEVHGGAANGESTCQQLTTRQQG